METQEIQEIVNTAITALQDNDAFLLKQDISEWAISHKLAVYLDDKFPDCKVDCEYNGYAKADNNKKYIMTLWQRLSELGKLKDSDGDEETLKRSVYPDIIVHQRGKEYNLLILEVKKEKNDDKDFDREKICRYTSPEYENQLNYKLGALIIFTTGKDEIPYEVEWYQNGKRI